MIQIVCAVVLAISSGAAPAGDAVSFYVSAQGNDAWSGVLSSPNAEGADGPFKTVERAVEAMRALRGTEAEGARTPVNIILRGGTHFLSTPLTLGPDDSGTASCPVTFLAYEGEKPILSGGRPVENWRAISDTLWATDLAPVREGAWYFRTLRVNDDWAIRARYPNFEPEAPRKGGWLFVPDTAPSAENGLFGVTVGNLHNKGDRLEWDVAVPVEADYVVWVRYGHAMKGHGKPSMDGQTEFGAVGGASAPLMDLPDTGSFAPTRWARAATLHFAAGKRTLYFQNMQGGGLDFDAFCLSDDPGWDPSKAIHIDAGTGKHTADPAAEGKHTVLVQAECYSKAVGPEIRVLSPPPAASRDRLSVRAEVFPQWEDWSGADVHIFPAWGWVNTIIEVKGVDKEASTLKVACPQDIRAGNRFYIAGTRGALDSPGEWHLDRKTGELVYWPVEKDFVTAEVVAPVFDRVVSLEGDYTKDQYVEHVHFRGIGFMDTTYSLNQTYGPCDGAIRMSGAAHCRVEECTFTRAAGYAVVLENRSHHNEIVRNDMRELGQGGVILTGALDTQAHHNLVAANTITDCGQIYKHVAAAYVTTGSDNRIAHNRIHRMPRYGISLKSFSAEGYSHNNIVEFNEIIDTNLETNDTGAIETLGRDRVNSGNVIRYNLIRNVVGFKTSPKGEIWSPYFTWGIYLDDYSSGTTILGNIVDGTVIGGVCIHGGKDNHVENNVFLNASSQQLRLQPRDDFMKGNTFLRNIVAYREPKAVLWYAYAKTWRPDRLSACDQNLYWCYGGLDIATTDEAITPEGSYKKWKEKGLDEHSVVADPGFISPELSHFALKKDSPAFALGYKAIPEDKIGPEGYVLANPGE